MIFSAPLYLIKPKKKLIKFSSGLKIFSSNFIRFSPGLKIFSPKLIILCKCQHFRRKC